MGNKKVFRSRISVLLIGFILAIFIPCTIPIFKEMIISGLYIMGGVLVFSLFILCGMRYIISGDKLYVKISVIPFGSIRISDIVSVERSYNILSSPAASLKRLQIRGANFSYFLISPVREQEFIKDLKAVNPDINVQVPDKMGVWRIQDWDI